MLSRIRIASGLALLLALVTSITVSAKGGYSFIAISGPGLDEEIRATDSGLTSDYFAFADFYRDKVETPSNPGVGYTITRYYVEGNRESAFDQLQYYPDTGFVFYDGIVNGDSEYDGEWYSANPAIKSVFQVALSGAQAQPVRPAEQGKPGTSVNQSRPVASIAPSPLVVTAAIMAGLLVLLMFAFRLRKPSIQ